VRVRSQQHIGQRIPDAVFAFRHGDPQFSFWEQRLRDMECHRAGQYRPT
jgi:hypothetical protein